MVIITATGKALDLDATLSASYTADVDVTKYPVEVGSPISDHARLTTEEVALEGLVSDAEVAGTVATMRGQLKSLIGTLVTLIGTYETYESMTPTKLEMPEDDGGGEALRFKLPCRKIRQVTLQQTLVGTKRGGKASKGPTVAGPTPRQKINTSANLLPGARAIAAAAAR